MATTAFAKYVATHPNAIHMKAVYDYVPEGGYEGNYLNFKTGDTIVVVEKREDGWWKGLMQNSEGLFPPNYCEELPPKRVLNVDTKKASPEIKRMQSILQLKVTGAGEEIQEVQQEADLPLTRERAQSDAHMFTVSKASSTAVPRMKGIAERVMQGKRMLEGRMAGEVAEHAKEEREERVVVESKPAAVVRQESIPKIEKPSISSELSEILGLKKRVSELEAEKADMVFVYTREKERAQDELQNKVQSLTEMLEEKVLVIEIMRKDLEIKTEETKEITTEMEMEIERLTQCCSDLAQQVVHLTPIPDEVIGPVHDLRSLPCIPNSRNIPTPRSAISPRSSTSSLTPAEPSPTSNSSSEPSPQSPSTTLEAADTPASTPSDSSSVSDTSKSSQESPSKPPAPRKSVSIANLAISIPSSDPPSPSPSDSDSPSDSSSAPPRITPRLKSLPSLTSLTRDFARVSNSPRGSNSPRPQTPRTLSSLSLNLDIPNLPRSDSKKNIHSFPELSAKLAEFGLVLAEAPTTTSTTDTNTNTTTTTTTSTLNSDTTPTPLRTSAVQPVPLSPASESGPNSEAAQPKSAATEDKPAKNEKIEQIKKEEQKRPGTPPLPALPIHASHQPPLSSSSESTKSQQSQQPQPQQQLRTRSRNKQAKEGSANINKEEPKEERERSVRGNLNWIQASVCFAFGSMAFYVVQALVERYNRPM